MLLGFGQVAAQKLDYVAARPAYFAQHALDLRDHAGTDIRRVGLHGQIRVGVAAATGEPFLQENQELRHQLPVRRRTEADRAGVAGGDRDAVMRKRRGQIKHVARGQQALSIGREALEDFQRRIFHQGQVSLPTHLPAPLARTLQQEHIVRIEMGSDAAPCRGETDHQIIEPAVRDEVKMR